MKLRHDQWRRWKHLGLFVLSQQLQPAVTDEPSLKPHERKSSNTVVPGMAGAVLRFASCGEPVHYCKALFGTW